MVINNDCVSVVRVEDTTLIIRCNPESSYFTLEEIGGDAVVIFKSSINNLVREVEKIKSLSEKPHGPKP